MRHLVFTRFCCRGATPQRRVDPISDAVVTRRLRLLGAITIPALAAQTTSAFTWVVVTDPDLAPRHRRELDAAVRAVPGAIVVTLDPGTFVETFTSHGFAARFVTDPDAPLVTTLLDDDDGFADDYLESIQRDVASSSADPAGPVAVLYGCEDPWQWDMFAVRGAPLGFRKPWSRGHGADIPFVVSAGYSIACRSARVGLTVGRLDHSVALAAFDPSLDASVGGPQERLRIAQARRVVDAAVGDRRGDPCGDASDGLLYRRMDPGPRRVALMTNHLGNTQFERILESPEQRERVVGAGSFPGFTVDVGAAVGLAAGSRRSVRVATVAVTRAVARVRRDPRSSRTRTVVAAARAAARASRDVWSLR